MWQQRSRAAVRERIEGLRGRRAHVFCHKIREGEAVDAGCWAMMCGSGLELTPVGFNEARTGSARDPPQSPTPVPHAAEFAALKLVQAHCSVSSIACAFFCTAPSPQYVQQDSTACASFASLFVHMVFPNPL